MANPDETATPGATTVAAPFKALLAAASLFVVVLGTAGFSLRWSYYYNFGLQDLVLKVPLASMAVAAVEILRAPHSIATLVLLIIEIYVPFQIVLTVLRLLCSAERPHVRRVARTVAKWSGLGSDLFVDVIRASLIVFVAFRAGAIVGSRDYQVNVVESTSRLARVTLLSPSDTEATKRKSLLVTCDTRPPFDNAPLIEPAFVGDPDALARLNGGAACSTATRTWRLLHRDDQYVYIVLTVSEVGRRPDMLAVPAGEGLTLILQ